MGALINSFNVGTDLSLTISNNLSGLPIVLDGKKTSFTAKSKDKLVESLPIDNGGIPDHRVIAAGWSGSIDVDKQSDDFQALYAALEANYFAGGPQNYFTITATVQRPDGSGPSRYQFLNAVFHSYDPGMFKKESIVTVTVTFDCAQMVKVS